MMQNGKRNESSGPSTRNPQPSPVRCAVYTRKSTEEGLDQAFNSLDAQRLAGENYVALQKTLNWVCLPDHYDDGGFSGGNVDRPALQRLLEHIEEGYIDCVVVQRVDRLSRSILDFTRLMEMFERHNVSFVSTTQDMNTATSMGRLTLNVLMSFAQFEREMIAERTRDKIAAARKLGKWTGGPPVLGYDIDPKGGRLIVNEAESARVRDIFSLYLSESSMLAVVDELDRRDWRTKSWTTRKGKEHVGTRFDRQGLYRLLSNPLYIGRIGLKGQSYPGEHEAIVDEEKWRETQTRLRRNGGIGEKRTYVKYGAMLAGLIRCKACGCAMVHSYTSKKRGTRYRYYVCATAQKFGWDTCTTRSVSAPAIEREVVERIKWIGRDGELIARVAENARVAMEGQVDEVNAQLEGVKSRMRTLQSDLHHLVTNLGPSGYAEGQGVDRVVSIQEEMKSLDQTARALRDRMNHLEQDSLDPSDVAHALQSFDPIWNSLTPREQSRVARLILERVVFDGEHETLEITFRPSGLKRLGEGIGLEAGVRRLEEEKDAI